MYEINEEELEKRIREIKNFLSNPNNIESGDFLMIHRWNCPTWWGVGFYDHELSVYYLSLRGEVIFSKDAFPPKRGELRSEDGYVPCGAVIQIPYGNIQYFDIRRSNRSTDFGPLKSYEVTEEGIQEIKH